KFDRAALAERVSIVSSSIVSQQMSNDDTIKLLLAWNDGSQAETVMIPDGDRRTACVSSQVGCPVQCRFCASGVNGVKGNLTAGQIVEQVVALNRILAGDGKMKAVSSGPSPRSISNIVFMGMGEPLANYANVMKA